MKRLVTIASMICASLSMSACTFNPQSSLSDVQQCTTLQQQMVFGGSFNASTTTARSDMNDRIQLNQQFQKLDCYDVLAQARQTQPPK